MFTIEWWFVLAIVIAAIVFIRFTIVREGTARAVMTLGKFSKIIFQWENHWMDEEWKILREGEKSDHKKKMAGLRIWGGLYLYGIWPIHRIHRYKHRWTDIRIRETGKMDLEFHEEELDHVLLKPAVYAIQLFAVETAPPERIPVDVLVLITLRIENPFLFLFVAPPTPIEDVLARISASIRVIITGCSLDDLLRLKGESLWTEGKKEENQKKKKPLLKGTKVIEDTLEKWGMKLADRGIEIKEINLPPEYQKAAAMQRKLEFVAAARSAETVGTVIEMMARVRGKKIEDIQKEIEAQPEMRREFLDLAKDLVVRKLGIEGRSYLDIRVQGAEGIERTILNALAVWQRIPMGRPSEREETEEEKPESKQEPEPGPLTADPALSKKHTEMWSRIKEAKKKYPERWDKRKRRKKK